MLSKLSVVTASSTFDLTVLSTLKADLGITNNDEDAKISRFINLASNMCAVYCDRVFARETVTETYRLPTTLNALALSRYPLASITSVVEDDTTLTASQYETNDPAGLIYRVEDDVRQDWAAAKIVVTYVGGYELIDGLPFGIEQAAIALAKMLYFNASRDPMLRSVDVPGVISESYAQPGVFGGLTGALPGDVAALLDPYRHIDF